MKKTSYITKKVREEQLQLMKILIVKWKHNLFSAIDSYRLCDLYYEVCPSYILDELKPKDQIVFMIETFKYYVDNGPVDITNNEFITYYSRNMERQKEYGRQYRARNKEKHREYGVKYREKNREILREKGKIRRNYGSNN